LVAAAATGRQLLVNLILASMASSLAAGVAGVQEQTELLIQEQGGKVEMVLLS
jgi:hypothetical protein